MMEDHIVPLTSIYLIIGLIVTTVIYAKEQVKKKKAKKSGNSDDEFIAVTILIGVAWPFLCFWYLIKYSIKGLAWPLVKLFIFLGNFTLNKDRIIYKILAKITR